MGELPRGTVTFLFTDIEGSTRLLQELGDAYADALAEHRRVLREAFARHGGVEVDTQGDSFFVAFARAKDALAAARDAQTELTGPIRIRIGVHTGEPIATDDGYVGIDVHRAARIAAVGHGGQVLVSQSTRELVSSDELRDLGEHRLKDLTAPERIYQLGDADFAPLKSLNATNLPVAASALIGRERELEDVAGLLMDSARLVTLTGTGGTGKTRLALQVAADLVGAFTDGVFFVPLAGVQQPELVASTILSTIGVRETDELREREALLVLDNFEHLLEAGPTVAELLHSGSRTKVLVTSRAPLRLDGEHEYPVDPLPQGDAIILLTERARAVRPDFTPDRTAGDICRRLDGLPLALELAASRLRTLGPHALLARLDQRLPVLTSGRRDAPERQRTLRATIEWSFGLLSPELQRLFVRLAVFATFTLEAAEVVVDAQLDDIDALVEASLVKRVGDERFLMLETIREFGLEQLAHGEDAAGLREGHAHYFLNVAEEAAPYLRGGGLAQVHWFGRLEEERDNLRLALAFFRTHDSAKELQIALALRHFWWMHGYVSEGRAHVLHAIRDGVPETTAGVDALEAAAYLAYLEHDFEDARRRVTDLAALAERLDEDLPRAKALHMRALLSEVLEEREEFEKRVIDLAGDDPVASDAAEGLGLVALRRGDLEEAREYFDQVLALNEPSGNMSMVSSSQILLALVSATAGDQKGALHHLNEGLRSAREIGDETVFVWERCWIVMATVLGDRGSPAEGLSILGAAERIREEKGEDLYGFTAEFHERTLSRLRALISDEEAESAWAHGKQLGSREYLERALHDLN